MSLLNEELARQATKTIKKKIQPTFKNLCVWFRGMPSLGLHMDKKIITYRELFSLLERVLTEYMLQEQVEIIEKEFAERQGKQQMRIKVLETELALVMEKVEKLTKGKSVKNKNLGKSKKK